MNATTPKAPAGARLLVMAALLLPACADDNVKPQEPIAPHADTTAYPEDPQLVPPEPPAEPPDPSDFEANSGALTDDPFGAPKNVPKMHDKSDDSLKDVPETPADQLNLPTDAGLDAAGEAGAAAGKLPVAKTPKTTPTLPDAPPPPAKYPDKKKKKSAGDNGGKKAEGGVVVRYVVPKLLNIRAKPEPRGKIVRQAAVGTKLSCRVEGLYCRIKDGEFVRASQLSLKPPKKLPKARP